MRPQRDRCVVDRLAIFRERGGKRGGETESLAARAGDTGVRVKAKSFSQLHRDRLSDLNRVLRMSEGLGQKLSGRSPANWKNWLDFRERKTKSERRWNISKATKPHESHELPGTRNSMKRWRQNNEYNNRNTRNV